MQKVQFMADGESTAGGVGGDLAELALADKGRCGKTQKATRLLLIVTAKQTRRYRWRSSHRGGARGQERQPTRRHCSRKEQRLL